MEGLMAGARRTSVVRSQLMAGADSRADSLGIKRNAI